MPICFIQAEMMFTPLDMIVIELKGSTLSPSSMRVSLLEVSMSMITYEHFEQGQHGEIMPAGPCMNSHTGCSVTRKDYDDFGTKRKNSEGRRRKVGR